MRHVLGLALIGMLGCAAEKQTVEQAMAQCMHTASQAAAPTAGVGIGASSDGRVSSSISIGFTADYLIGRSPDQAFESCVIRRSGVPPTRPYSAIISGRSHDG